MAFIYFVGLYVPTFGNVLMGFLFCPDDALGLSLRSILLCFRTLSARLLMRLKEKSPYTLQGGLRCLHSTLTLIVESSVEWTSSDEMQYHASLIEAPDASVSNALGFVDGFNLAIQHSLARVIQNAANNA